MARLLHRGQGHLSIRLLGVLRCEWFCTILKTPRKRTY